ncbi:diguanylate cyclase domain-containing protein [Frankia sp. ACN1ag]|uniref:diguanylate cyclase domain-containing protein n=1 Tax=Frankia sp. ACN1ag TaxID=102891 RepID=UPI0006DC2073|nr:diguanylate cyclase [Frankia sp. ACN1ag]KQC36230.1 diguanylate cyclase [Frankia sp. ACN1ag]
MGDEARAPARARPPGFGGPPVARWWRRTALGVAVVAVAVALATLTLPARAALIMVRAAALASTTSGTLACFVTAARSEGAERTWRVLVGVMVLALSGTALASLHDVVHGGQPVPHITLPMLALLVPWLCGLAGVLRYPTDPFDSLARGTARQRRWYLITVLDSVIVTGAVALLAWVTVLENGIKEGDHPVYDILPALVVTAAALVTAVTIILIATFRRPRSLLGLSLLGSGLMVFALAIMIYLYATTRDLADLPRILDLGFVTGPLLVGLAALLPPGQPPLAVVPAAQWTATQYRRRWWHVMLPYLPLLVAGAVAVVRVVGTDLAGQEEIWALLCLLVLALLRQMTTMADNVRLLERLEDNQGELRRLAFHDPLTGLANRALFADRLDQTLARYARVPHPVAVVFCDLDDFKQVNDALGHAAGDELLRVTARRLTATVRATDTVARFGGDEFAILLESAPAGDAEDPVVIGHRLAEAVRLPVRLADTTYAVAASFGLVVVGPADTAITAETLLHRADLAMYSAKSGKSGLLTVYDADLGAPDTIPALQAALAAAARDDPSGGRLGVCLRPVVDLATDEVPAYQARLEWHHPRLGVFRPQRLAVLGDTAGVGPALDRFLLRHALAWVARRTPSGARPAAVHVPLLAERASHEGLPAEISSALADAGLPAGALVLDIRGTSRDRDPDTTAEVLTRLHRAGVRISLAEVGSADTTVDSLRLLPVDMITLHPAYTALWVDRSTPDRLRILTDAFLATVIDLGIEVIADGVDTRSTARRLLERGCHLATGDIVDNRSPPPATAARV